jgi:anti-anti-sigma regulatory factor
MWEGMADGAGKSTSLDRANRSRSREVAPLPTLPDTPPCRYHHDHLVSAECAHLDNGLPTSTPGTPEVVSVPRWFRTYLRLDGLVETLGNRSFILNYSRAEGLTSATLTQLLSFKKKVAGAGGRLALCAVAPEVQAILARTYLDRAIPIYPTEQYTVQALRLPGSRESD